MDLQTLARILALLPPIAAVAWLFRATALEAAARAVRLRSLREHAASRGLSLGAAATLTDFALTGTHDGAPLAIDTPLVGSGKSGKRVTRLRLQAPAGADPYRHGAAAEARARLVLVRRDQPVDLDAIAGLGEVPSGDAAFDALYRGYAAPGGLAPWSRAGFRAAVTALGQRAEWRLDRLDVGPAEATVVLASPVADPPALDRAALLAAAALDPARAPRLDEALSAPIVWAPPPEVARAEASWGPLGWGLFGAFVVGGPGAFLNPAVRALVEVAACDDGWTLGTSSAGKGVKLICRHAGRVEGASFWAIVVSFSFHFLVIAALVAAWRAFRRREPA